MKRFLEGFPAYPKDLPNDEIRQQRVSLLLGKAIYAGYVEAIKWGVSRRKGNHKGIISYKTFEKIQTRLTMGVLAPARKDISNDFSLRGFVTCGDCNKTLRSCWSTGKYKKYPYYLCHNRGCASYGKSIRRNKIESEFAELLQQLTPTKELFQMAKAMIENAWYQRLAQTGNIQKAYRQDVKKIEHKIIGIINRLVDTENKSTIKAYENKISILENEKLVLHEKLRNKGKPQNTYAQIIELSLNFLANPLKLWETGNAKLQKIVLRLVFTERLAYHRNEGYRTPKTSLPFNILEGISTGDLEMVPQERISD